MSVPPEMLHMGTFPPPIFSNSHIHDSSSHGSPVEPKARTPSMGFSRDFALRDLTRVGEIPSRVTPFFFTMDQSLFPSGKSMAPSYWRQEAPREFAPITAHGPIIHPKSDTQKRVSSGLQSI